MKGEQRKLDGGTLRKKKKTKNKKKQTTQKTHNKKKKLLTYLFKTEIKSINKTSKFKVLALVCYNILSFNSSTKYK